MIGILTAGFVILVPLYTYLLLVLKGLPDFAVSHQLEVVVWVYRSTGLAALVSGLLVSMIISLLLKKTRFFRAPLDFGRCFSAGGVLGALAEVPSTYLHRALSHRPYSDFWMGGAMIAGFLAGVTMIPWLLWRFKAGEVES